MQTPLQAEFATSLLKADRSAPHGIVVRPGADPAKRFAVYRNNVVTGLVRALESRFPVVRRLVGEEFFRAMAQVFVTEDPPRSPVLFRYGNTFPDFIENFGPASDVPFLADVARLELARGRAYHAADMRSLPAEDFAPLDADRLAVTGVRLHPSAELLTSSFPIVSIWRGHQDEAEPRISSWQAEAALVLRPVLEVEVYLLPAGGYQFLTALSQGASLSRAATVAAAEAPLFNAVKNLALLIETGVVVKLVSARPI